MLNSTADMPLLLRFLRTPEVAEDLDAAQWLELVGQARAVKLLPYVHLYIDRHGLHKYVSKKAADHIESAVVAAHSIYYSMLWELECLQQELGLNTDWMVLKGGAYVAVDLPHSHFRETGDIDVLLKPKDLACVETALVMQGWKKKSLDQYDDQYYRIWSHELPPLMHPVRDSVLDIHHNIYPVISSRVRCNMDVFWRGGQRTVSGVCVPGPEGLFLHSALHLFMQEEFSCPLRDLVDLKELYLYYQASDPGYFQRLEVQAVEMNLDRAFWLAVRYLDLVLALGMPHTAVGKMNWVSRWAFDWCFLAIVDEPVRASRVRTFLARQLLTARGFALKMPPRVLVRHVSHKVINWFRGRWARDEAFP